MRRQIKKLFTISFFLLFSSNTLAQKKISPGAKPKVIPKTCNGSESCNGSANVEGGKADNKSVFQELTAEQSTANNNKAAEFVQSQDEFFRKKKNSKLQAATKATVQILPKCAIGIKGDGYSIEGDRPEYCKGHPLSKSSLPNMPEDLPTMAGKSPSMCAAKPCSGALVGDQQTITTAAHCVEASSPEEFCKNFVFVFNRIGDKTEFAKDEVSECDTGAVVNTNREIKDFNMNADYGSKDHAGFRLKKPVPESIAKALKPRTTELNDQEELYASGHPAGSSRMISTLTAPRRVASKDSSYGYVHMEGYVYQGNSGGPLLDRNGEVVGILSAVDDKRHGDRDAREPNVADTANGGRRCRTQVAPGAIKIEAITYGTEIKGLMQNLPSIAPAGKPPVDNHNIQ